MRVIATLEFSRSVLAEQSRLARAVERVFIWLRFWVDTSKHVVKYRFAFACVVKQIVECTLVLLQECLYAFFGLLVSLDGVFIAVR